MNRMQSLLEYVFLFQRRKAVKHGGHDGSHRNRCTDRRQRRVIMDHKIIYHVIENCFGAAKKLQPRLALWLAGELFGDQMRVVEIEVDIAPHPHQFARQHVNLLRDHAGEQRGRPQVERQTQRDVAASLI